MERKPSLVYLIIQFVVPFLIGVGIAIILVTWKVSVSEEVEWREGPAMAAQPSMIIEPMNAEGGESSGDGKNDESKLGANPDKLEAEPVIDEAEGDTEQPRETNEEKERRKKRDRAEKMAKGNWACRHRWTKWLAQNSLYIPPDLNEHFQRYNRLHDKALRDLPAEEAFKLSLTSAKNTVRYIVWRPVGDDLAGRLLSLVSTFLLALLTDRVLLVNFPYVRLLFCEPFTKSTWIFPQKHLADLNKFVMMKDALQTRSPLRIARLKLKEEFVDDDSIFVTCNGNIKTMLSHVQMVLVESPVGFVELIASNPSHRNRISTLFQDLAIYPLLMHHLLHPANDMWFRIIDAYHAHFTNHQDRPARLGIYMPLASDSKDNKVSLEVKRKVQCAIRKLPDQPLASGKIMYYSPSSPTNNPKLWAKRAWNIPANYEIVTAVEETSKKGYLGDWRRLLTDIWMGSWTNVYTISVLDQASLATHYYRAKESWVIGQVFAEGECKWSTIHPFYLSPLQERSTDCTAFRQEWRAKNKKKQVKT